MIKCYFTIMLCFIVYYAAAQAPKQLADSIKYKESLFTYDSLTSFAVTDSTINILKKSEESYKILSDSLNNNFDATLTMDSIENAYKKRFADTLSNNQLQRSYDSLNNLNSAVQEKIRSAPTLENEQRKKFLSSFSDSLQEQQEKLAKGLDINEIIEGYDQQQLQQLPPLNARIIKEQKNPALDSLRQHYLKHEKLKYKEKELEQEYKEVVLKKKESLVKRSFFEGIIGMNNDFKVISISPAFGVQLNNALALGLGLNLGIDANKPSDNLLVGIRTFAKYEILKGRLYLQVEDNSYWPGISYPNWGDKLKSNQINHAILVGGGYLLKFSPTKSFNLALLYQVNENAFTSNFNAPVTMRLGMNFYNKK